MPTTVILGAGIIGLSSAHSLAGLAPPDHRIHIVEPAPTLFSSASGKAAGFLAKDWFAPAVAPLGLLSFDLHHSLSEQHNGRARWGYSESISYSLDHTSQFEDSPGTPLSGSSGGTSSDSENSDECTMNVPSLNGAPGETGLDWLLSGASRATVVDADAIEADSSIEGRDLPKWLRAKPEALEVISDRKSTAQVHPRRLCEFLLEECLAAGVTLHHPARATKLLHNEKDPAGVIRVRVEYQYTREKSGSPDAHARIVDIPSENIIIAAGCWTPQVYTTLFPNASRIPRISHLAGYSVTVKTSQWPPPPVPVPALPTALRAPDEAETSSPEDDAHTLTGLASGTCHAIFTDAAGFAPEIFSRATGDVWLGGLNPSTAALPALPTDAQLDAGEVERLLAVARALCGEDVEVRKRALCFRPVSATGRPIIARMHEADLGDGLKPAGLDGAGGVYVATGHGPWGISQSLGTGRVVAEMVLGLETSADVAALARWDGVIDADDIVRTVTP